MKLEFTANDFHSHQCPPLGDNPRTYARLAEFVNLRIEEMLKEGIVVKFRQASDHDGTLFFETGSDTHTGIIVDIKPIEESGK